MLWSQIKSWSYTSWYTICGQFKFNMLSVSALIVGSHLTVGFFHDHFIIQNAKIKKMIGMGDRLQDLYVLDTKALNSTSYIDSTPIAFVNNVSIQVCRNRLDHLSFRKLECLKNEISCDTSNFNKCSPCYICPFTKQRNHFSRNPFDLVHYDIYTRHKFFLKLVDDCSRFTYLFLLKQNSCHSSFL